MVELYRIKGLFNGIPHTDCHLSAPWSLNLLTPVRIGSLQNKFVVFSRPGLLLNSHPVWMCVCSLFSWPWPNIQFLFLSAVGSAVRHLYCFPVLSQRAWSQSLSLFGYFPFLLSCFTFPHPSAQMVWTIFGKLGMSHWLGLSNGKNADVRCHYWN